MLDFGDESTNPYDFDQTTTPTPPGGNCKCCHHLFRLLSLLKNLHEVDGTSTFTFVSPQPLLFWSTWPQCNFALVVVVVFFVLAILHSISCALDRRQQSENEKAREREPHMRAGAL